MKEQFIAGIKKALSDIVPESWLLRLGEETSLRDLGIDSVDIAQVVIHLENVFQISFSDEDLVPENFRDVASLIRLLEGKKAEARSNDPLLSS